MITYKTLDDTLRVLVALQDNPQPDFQIFAHNTDLSILANGEKEAIIRKLKKDGLIDTVEYNQALHKNISPPPDKKELYFISVEGLMLLNLQQGYEGRNKTKILSDSHQLKLTRLIAVGTILAALVAVVALLLSFLHTSSCG